MAEKREIVKEIQESIRQYRERRTEIGRDPTKEGKDV
jgi:hypothetical protein